MYEDLFHWLKDWLRFKCSIISSQDVTDVTISAKEKLEVTLSQVTCEKGVPNLAPVRMLVASQMQTCRTSL